MALSSLLNFSGNHRLPMIHQTEAAECGLACLAMVASYHGHRVDLASLRSRHASSLKGATLAHLMRVAGAIDLTPRAVRLDLEHLPQLKTPAILHWDMNHFVVLKGIRGDTAIIHDPARGERRLAIDELSTHFTGVALEVTPTSDFRPREERRRLTLRQLLGEARGLPRIVLQILVLSLGLQICMLVMPWFLQMVVDHVLLSADTNLLKVLGIGFGLLVLIQASVGALRAWMIQYLSANLSLQVLNNLFRHLLRLPMDYFLKRHIGDVVSRLGSADTVQHTLSTSFIEAFVDGAMVVVTLIVMLFYSPLLAGIACGAAVLYAIGRWLFYRPFREATEEQIVRVARKDSSLLETIRGTQSLRLFNRETQRQGVWQNLVADSLNADIRVSRLQIGFDALSGVLFGVENVAVIWLGALAIMEGGFSVGMLFAFMAYKRNFSTGAAALIEKIIEYRMLDLHLERISDIALTEPEAQGAESELTGGEIRGHVHVENLSYQYAPNEPAILENVTFEVRPGESVAITGPSGCGKTTLMKIMLGLLAPTAGRVLVDGIDIHKTGTRRFREAVGTVMQDDQLFAGSIADNICFFDDKADLQRIATCAMVAAVHEDILRMPMGYETLVGDMGTVLSGGQKQRVLLARALYKQPRLLFLDEATSHLDVGHEQLVNQSIKQLNITRVIIAHREETIDSTDRIITLGKPNLDTSRKAAKAV
ncbi:MAG TPA: peptidase domain-containing ABC transporter [Gammaproteobacteria bacterium]